MLLLEALRNGRAQREVLIDNHLHQLTIRRNPSSYRLIRKVFDTWQDSYYGDEPICEIEQIWDFRYLTDLFATARRENFIGEVNPRATDWKDDDYPKLKKLNPWLSPEEEKELEERAEHEWEIDHPEEVRAEQLIETRWEELGRNERIYYEE